MRSNLRFWLALSVLLGAGTIIVWFKGRPAPAPVPAAWSGPGAAVQKMPALLSATSLLASQLGAKAGAPTEAATNRGRYQLSNVGQSIDALVRVESAVLMRNALIDTRAPLELGIPENLRAGPNPGAYIVQAIGPATAAFQKMLKDAGAEIVSYIPNNAFLVKADSGAADLLRNQRGVQAVLDYEPYYKIDTRLMKFAVDHEAMSEGAWLRVTLFPGSSPSALEPLALALGGREPSPFGEQFLLQPRSGSLTSLAHLPEVQIIEPWNPRVAANDLTRVRLGIATNTITTTNYLNLTGSNVWVNVNDIGVDSTHPELQGRVFYHGNNAMTDPDGHGTHVAATIAGIGSITEIFDKMSALPTNSARLSTNTVTNPDGSTSTNVYLDGSLTNASFRGMAPKAKLFVLPIDFTPDVHTPVTDTYLIETAARTNYQTLQRTNTMVSNNSWNYANSTDYDSQAARFDAATRDALPDVPGSQPVLYLFAAGNQGFGDEEGQGGEPGRIASPGTAKNVITVGALETLRYIAEGLTNVETRVEGTNTNTFTNTIAIFLPITDSDDQIASFSSRGNVGIGIEGNFGRFKPDVVAPGTFIMSARSKLWDLKNDYDPAQSQNTSNIFNVLSNLNSVTTEYRYDSGTSFAVPGVSGLLALVQEFFGEVLQPPKRRFFSPALMKALLINSARSVHQRYDLAPETRMNFQGWGGLHLPRILPGDTNSEAIFRKLDEKDWPLVLIEQSPTNAVATGQEIIFKLDVDTNALSYPLRFTLVWTDPPANPQASLKLVNDLDLVVQSETVVDGKTNIVTWHGNDILNGRDYTEARDSGAFGGVRDVVNNVENIFIADPRTMSNITVRVMGRRVNVKSISDYYNRVGAFGTNEIVQDFALVVSSEQTGLESVFKKFERQPGLSLFNETTLEPILNAVELNNQRVGANSALLDSRGATNQWRFYVFTNNNDSPGLLTAGSNVAFITSAPLALGIPRASKLGDQDIFTEPDIDLYVSRNPFLSVLEPNAVANALKSTNSGGSELIVLTNAAIDDVYYLAVKSEDQQAAEFTIITISTDEPFEDGNGKVRRLRLFPVGAILDGSATFPSGRRMYGVPITNRRLLDASLYLLAGHDEFGDLVGNIYHKGLGATLFSHTLNNGEFTGTNAYLFSDSPYTPQTWPLPPEYDQFGPYPGPIPFLLNSDGPRTLARYSGLRTGGEAWVFQVVDSAPSHTGLVERAEIYLRPVQRDIIPGEQLSGSVAAGDIEVFLLDVPNDATKVTFTITSDSPDLLALIRREFLPSTNIGEYDFLIDFTNSTSVTLSIDANSQPPLVPGEYFVGLLNKGTTVANYTLLVTIEVGDAGKNLAVIGDSRIPIKDDSKTISIREYKQDKIVTGAAVAIVAEKARVSDLVLHLVSPQGTRVLLAENRGRFSDDFGSTNSTVNFVGPSYAVFSDTLGLPIKFTPPPFGDESPLRGPVFGNGFEGAPDGIYPVGSFFDGWGVSTNQVSVVTGDAATGLNYVNLGSGGISNSLPTVQGRSYRLSFAYRGRPTYSRVFINNNHDWTNQPAVGPVFSTGQSDTGLSSPVRAHTNAPAGTVDTHYRIFNNPDSNYPPAPGESGTALFVSDPAQLGLGGWFANDTNSQWLSMAYPGSNRHPGGEYTNRTTFVVLDDPNRVRVNARVAADDSVVNIFVNGVSTGISGGSTGGYSAPFTLSGPFIRDLNTIDFVVTNASVGYVGFRAQLSMALVPTVGPTNSSQLITNASAVGYVSLIGSETNSTAITGVAEWRTYETEFVADRAGMGLQFLAAGGSPGLEIDDVKLEDTGTVFMHPEEPLAVLEGERAMGDWRLEAWDNRTGANVPAEIVDWQILLSTANSPRLAEALAPDKTYPATVNHPTIRANTNYTVGRIFRGEIEWFYFDVCTNATALSISMATPAANSSALELLVDRSGFPTGDPSRDDYVLLRSTALANSTVTFALTLDNPAAAPLQPGKRIFFAVRNFNRFRTNIFALKVANNGCPFTAPTPLILGQAFSDYSFPSTPGDQGNTYQATTPGPAVVEISTESPGDIVVLASKGMEPTAERYDVRLALSGNSGTLALPTGGAWFLRVVNEGSTTVPYSIKAVPAGGFAVRDVSLVANHLRVSWESVPGQNYEIASSTDLQSWTVIATVPSAGSETTYEDPNAASGVARFLRIRPVTP